MPNVPWTVVGVFDPHDDTAGFAYTVGLHRLGLPEVQLRAVPSTGGDGTWKFSHRDLHHLVNDFAEQVRTGTLRPGDSQTRTMDEDMATVTFTLGQPGPGEPLEAIQVDDGAQVIPVTWHLALEPAGELAALDPAVEAEARRRYDELRDASLSELSLFGTQGVGPAHLPPAAEATFDPHQPYGPLTPLVTAYADGLRTVYPEVVADFLDNTMRATMAGVGEPAHVLAHSAALARRHGRTQCLEECKGLSLRVADKIVEGDGWDEIVARLGDGSGPDEQFTSALKRLLYQSTAALLASAVVDDVLPDHVRALASGPWRWALEGVGPQVPGALWCAPQPVLDAVAELLKSATKGDVRALERAYEQATSRESFLDVYWALHGRRIGTASTSEMGPAELAPGTPFAVAYEELVQANMGDVADNVADAFGLIVAGVAGGEALPPQWRHELVKAFGAVLPGLAEALTLVQTR